MSRGIESGRLPPFSLYRKLKRTTPMPCSWNAFAVASIERSDMLPPAPCAQTKIGTSALVRVPGSYTAVVLSVPTATFHSTGLISCMPPDISIRTATSPQHMSQKHRHQRVACLAAVLLAVPLRPTAAQQLGYKLLGSAGIDA